MKIAKLKHDPMMLADFFEEGLSVNGALCERTWHDKLQVVAEGKSARVWQENGALLETEIHFLAADSTAQREAARDVFPGCPLVFRLAESLRESSLTLEKCALLPLETNHRPPAPDVAERLWHAQESGCSRWRLETPLISAWHFSLAALIRAEIQAIDQQWFLHRAAISLADGALDDSLATALDFAQVDASANPPWPKVEIASWKNLLEAATQTELTGPLETIRRRQENYLRRELERIDDYFDRYEAELKERENRSGSDATKAKIKERLAATQTERRRRWDDQVHRHEIRIIPHVDSLLLLAEPAWQARVSFARHGQNETQTALYISRKRKWIGPERKI